MTVPIYPFICTKQTYPVQVPATSPAIEIHQRQVHNAFAAMGTGFRRVGDVVFRFKPDPFDDHLLCDGTTLNIASFPQLFQHLGNAFGGDGLTTFALPNALGTIDFAVTAPEQTVSTGGTVSNADTVITTPTTAGQTGGTSGGNVSSGGRTRPDEKPV